MTTLIILVFVTGYFLIAFENPLRINKAAAALITGVICWTLFFLSGIDQAMGMEKLMHHLAEISSVLFFLLGAMTIVELIDSHDGFVLITSQIKTRRTLKLLWIITSITFFLSSILDNLTTAIVMTSISAKLLENKNDRLWFLGMIIIAANAGGAFSPLGDVTTTLLWVGGQITAQRIIIELALPSLAVVMLPLAIIGFRFRKQTFVANTESEMGVTKNEALTILILGISLLLLVPVFSFFTHLPPFMGMLLGLSLLWIVASIIHVNKPTEIQKKLTVTYALEKIDTPSILFFLGILLAVAALDSMGILHELAAGLNHFFPNLYGVGTLLGVVSAIVDNVPLVAAAQGMYDLQTYPTDHHFWAFLALTTGTGGSAIIIGSAAGVAAMGIEKVDFMWYLKNITWIALTGFIAGILVFILQTNLLR